MHRDALRSIVFAAMAIACLAPVPTAAQDRPTRIQSLDDIQAACRRAEADGPRELLVISFRPRGWRFGAYDHGEGFLPVDTSQNFRVFGGHAAFLPAHMEQIGFIVGAERAGELRGRAGGLILRVGFFLGFDEDSANSCLIRPAAGVTTVRMDVAFLELSEGRRMVARQDTDRLRAWRDDAERDAIPGQGPRGAMGAATLGDRAGVAPEPWQQTLGAENRGAVARAIGLCHRAGVARGARDGQVVVRIAVDPRTGRVSAPEVELSSVGDDQEAACVAGALVNLSFVPVPALGSRVVLSVPVRLRR